MILTGAGQIGMAVAINPHSFSGSIFVKNVQGLHIKNAVPFFISQIFPI